ncbi:hypothetical protein JT30_5924 [Burkholderia pseudomallei]|nr:hypothetical protein JT30_5924 [Burkholderia pseudomallei]
MEHGYEHRRRRRLIRWIQALALSALLAIGVTWIGAAVDHPVERAIVDGMAAPECAQVRAMPAGSLLSARQPDSAVCRSFFLYRAAYVDAASNAPGYSAAVMRARASTNSGNSSATCSRCGSCSSAWSSASSSSYGGGSSNTPEDTTDRRPPEPESHRVARARRLRRPPGDAGRVRRLSGD